MCSGCRVVSGDTSEIDFVRLAIMQPYLFPYIGYFQLIHAVDTFVVYDDVNYMKGGWINRNFILSHGAATRLTLPLQGASPNVLINEVTVGDRRGRAKLLKTVAQSYARAPHFKSVIPLVEEVLLFEEPNLAIYLDHSLRKICEYLELDVRWIVSSELRKDSDLRGQEKVLTICEMLGATHYINLPGGRDLYVNRTFERHGLQLSFLHHEQVGYKQFTSAFIPNLSIVDVMMFNNREHCANLLGGYSLA